MRGSPGKFTKGIGARYAKEKHTDASLVGAVAQ